MKAFLLPLIAAAVAGFAAAAPPPNIVLVLADDLGINDLRCYGRKDHSTPHLDRLAAEGMRFTSAYCAQPICSPSRAALMTGKEPARLHLTNYLPGRADTLTQKLIQPVMEGQLPLEEVTLAEVLKGAGYATACIGKWHLGGPGFGPEKQGFETVHAGSAQTTPTETEGSKGESDLTARAARFVDENKDKPFFLFLAHNSPHIPFAARPEEAAKHNKTFNPTYAAVIESLDSSVGRLLEKIDAAGVAERTIFIFTSDNGGLHVPEGATTPATLNLPYRAGKGFLHEGGLRVPLIIRYPGLLTPGSGSDAPVMLSDLMPTLIEAAGLDAATSVGPLAGRSLLGLFRDGEAPERQLFWHFPHYTNQGGRPGGAVRDGRWKLIADYESGTTQLFDLYADSAELDDLADEQPGIVDELSSALVTWRQRIGAQECRSNPDVDLEAHAQLYEEMNAALIPPVENATMIARPLRAWRTAMNAAVKGRSPRVTPATGDIRLFASQAQVHGKKLRYEPEPFKQTLGYWTETGDWAEWMFEPPAAGRYELEIQQGCGPNNGGSEVEVTIAGQPLRFTVTETGHFQHFIQRTIGEVDLPAGKNTLTVKPLRKAKSAVMDLRRIVLRPVKAS